VKCAAAHDSLTGLLRPSSPLRETGSMHTRRVGRHGLLVECVDLDDVAATYAAVQARSDDLGVSDVVPAARRVLLVGLLDVVAAARLLADLDPAPGRDPATAAPVVEIPVTYDGDDLAEVARQWEVDTTEVTRIHRGTEFRVAFCGFAPGFAYCTGLPEGLHVTRRDEPRPRVPAGSVALAGEFTSVYPSSSPGGWQLIGTTTTRVWRPEGARPALLEPGTRVRFVDA
jgi:KipI family sensor histidine kinase inhibitor